VSTFPGEGQRDEMARLFRARISFENNNADRRSWLDMTVAPKGEFWWSIIKDPDQTALWASRIQLRQDFFDGIIWPLRPASRTDGEVLRGFVCCSAMRARACRPQSISTVQSSLGGFLRAGGFR
jgi:hypothetical protein